MGEHTGVDNVHTRRIAEFVAGLTYEQIPPDVRERIKLLVLDSLGCAVYGAELEWCRIARETCAALDATRTTSVWGTVTRWEPPRLVAFTWHAGTPEAEATRVEVTFTEDGPGSTVVVLVHSGWEHRPDGASVREGYDSGWEPVIGRFAETAARLR